MPDLIKAYNNNRAKFVVIGINWNDTTEDVKQYLQEFKVPYPITIDNTGDLILLFRAKGHPTNIFIDKNGIITNIVPGMVSPQLLDQQLGKLLAQ
ncbi:MAG: TlpA family protein disulfide reductase [Chloroflexi bacterium]|nr:TlpA family protein disulfide reductase [Chloroflexota bacterium]